MALPREKKISIALLTLNFFQLDNEGKSAAERHVSASSTSKGYVQWKNILTGSWHGPDLVLTWARGSVCVFPQNR